MLRLVLVSLCVCAASCRFDPSGLDGEGGGVDPDAAARPDARPGGVPDAGQGSPPDAGVLPPPDAAPADGGVSGCGNGTCEAPDEDVVSCPGDCCAESCDGSCDGCCTDLCGEEDCDLTCAECGCFLDCEETEGTCEVSCSAGVQCHIDCTDVNNCRPTCSGAAQCHIDCRDANNCDDVRCDGAACLLLCQGADNCSFDASGCTGPTSCAGNIKVCNRDCP